jgi:MFS family permease
MVFFASIADKIGKKTVLAITFSVLALGCLLTVFATNITSLLLYRAIIGIGVSSFTIVTEGLVALFSVNKRSVATGLFYGTQGIAGFIGPIAFGALFASAGTGLTYELLAILAVIAAICGPLGLIINKREKAVAPATGSVTPVAPVQSSWVQS